MVGLHFVRERTMLRQATGQLHANISLLKSEIPLMWFVANAENPLEGQAEHELYRSRLAHQSREPESRPDEGEVGEG